MVDDKKIIQTGSNTWKFPVIIDFDKASMYIIEMKDLSDFDEIILDMTETARIHSSFIGFLIDLKNKSDSSGKKLVLKLSPYLENLLNKLDLYRHFFS